MKHDDPSKGRGDGPGPSMESALVADVEHCARRLALAEQLLKEWRLSHGNDTKPASVYTQRGITEHRLDGSGWRRG
jgi:hypothetical protein